MTLVECLERIEQLNDLRLDERHAAFGQLARAVMRAVLEGNRDGEAMMRALLERTSET